MNSTYQATPWTRVIPCMLAIYLLLPFARIGAQENLSDREVESLEQRLALAGDNRTEMETALKKVPLDQRPGLEFLILNMPNDDLKSLTSEFLLTNIKLAYQARAEAAWTLPDKIFMNEVLPYANIDEPRDPWRAEMYQLCKPLIRDCRTPAEAAQRLNETVFKEISVKYSTKRKRANQSPKESIEQGLASCTGLSIILVDACRSVGVPARLAGIPSWKNKRGNHTWVEVWDKKWHFTGAAEPNEQGLNHTWFQADAALADPQSKIHSIYAASFKQTNILFPMVWSPGKRVSAENVTQRYLRNDTPETDPNKIKLAISTWGKGSQRIVCDIEIRCNRCQTLVTGKTKAGTHDLNDMATFELDANSTYEIHFRTVGQFAGISWVEEIKTSEKPFQTLRFEIPSGASNKWKMPKSKLRLTVPETTAMKLAADEIFGNRSTADEAIAKKQVATRHFAWEQYRASRPALMQKDDYDKQQVVFEKHLSPYTVKAVGTRPENGWPLVIAMHGGGGVPKRFNDSQWKHMQIYYKDQESVQGYKYLALRAPNDTWNGFYDDYVYPLIENLVRQFILYGDIDPNKVFIMGYSHGGYGAFSIGPKIPYRFAAIHASAAAPTPGQSSAKTLRNTRFTFMVGEKDNAYGRRERCEAFSSLIDDLKQDNPGQYPVEFLFKKGYGHGGLPDRNMISEMYSHVRNPTPKHLTWEMTDSVVKRFFWLKCDQPKRGQLIDVKIENNTIDVQTEECESFSIFLDSRLVDPTQPIKLNIGGSTNEIQYQPSFETLCKTIVGTGDINLAFDFEIKINLTK